MKKYIIPTIVVTIVSIIIATNTNNIVKAWDIVSNYAAGFIAVPGDGSKGYKKNNLVALDSSGKLPVEVLPASATNSGGGGGLFYSCGPCPTGSILVGNAGMSISSVSDVPKVIVDGYSITTDYNYLITYFNAINNVSLSKKYYNSIIDSYYCHIDTPVGSKVTWNLCR